MSLLLTPKEAALGVELFGTKSDFARALGVHRATIYTWLKPVQYRGYGQAYRERHPERVRCNARERSLRYHHRHKHDPAYRLRVAQRETLTHAKRRLARARQQAEELDA